MALGVPHVEMQNVALAVGLRRIELRVGLRRPAEHRLTIPATPDAIRVLQRMTGFMSQNAHAPVRGSTFDLQHLGQFQFCQSRMGQIEGHGNAGDPVWRKPFIGEPEVRTKGQPPPSQFRIELVDLWRDLAPFNGEMQVTEAQIEQSTVGPIGPLRLDNIERLIAHDLCSFSSCTAGDTSSSMPAASVASRPRIGVAASPAWAPPNRLSGAERESQFPWHRTSF